MNHNEQFEQLIKRDGTHSGDTERRALFWILSSNDDIMKKVGHIYDFEENWIKLECLESPDVDFCSSSRSLIRLGFNLYNGYHENGTDVLSIFCTLDDQNYAIAMEAIKIRLGR